MKYLKKVRMNYGPYNYEYVKTYFRDKWKLDYSGMIEKIRLVYCQKDCRVCPFSDHVNLIPKCTFDRRAVRPCEVSKRYRNDSAEDLLVRGINDLKTECIYNGPACQECELRSVTRADGSSDFFHLCTGVD